MSFFFNFASTAELPNVLDVSRCTMHPGKVRDLDKPDELGYNRHCSYLFLTPSGRPFLCERRILVGDVLGRACGTRDQCRAITLEEAKKWFKVNDIALPKTLNENPRAGLQAQPTVEGMRPAEYRRAADRQAAAQRKHDAYGPLPQAASPINL